MLKKFLTGLAVVVVISAVVVGVVALAKGPADGEGNGQRGRWTDTEVTGEVSQGQGGYRGGQGGAGNEIQRESQQLNADALAKGRATGESQGQQGRRADTEVAGEVSQGQGGYRGGQGGAGDEIQRGGPSEAPQLNADPLAPAENWETINGLVTSVEESELVLLTDEGQEIPIELGPEWFWEQQGVALIVGDEVQVIGFWEGDTFEVAQISVAGSQESVTLRDEDGRPLWAGRGGRGGGRGQSSGQGRGAGSDGR